MTRSEEILRERWRQMDAEGYAPEKDDEYVFGELGMAAAAYAACDESLWPWSVSTFKPTTPERDLIKAGALILAELDRRERKARKEALASADRANA